jgi:endo-1,4-beta-xylanase
MIRRRDMLKAAVLALGSSHIPDVSETAISNAAEISTRFADSLRARATAKGVLYGAAAGRDQIIRDPDFRAAFTRECALLTPENELKWDTVRPAPTSFNFGPADELVKYARENGILVRGHTLAWHEQNPAWLSQSINPSNARQLLTNHISALCRHYAGKMHSWDVVNEAVETSSSNTDGLRSTIWLNNIGPEYIHVAFRAASEADPSAVLCYNDYNLEMDVEWQKQRRDRVLKLLRELKSQGVPVHALGIQTHVTIGYPFDAAVFRTFLDRVASMGLAIHVTEMDISDKNLPSDISSRDATVADFYRRYLDCVLACPAVRVIATWGISDKYTWLNDLPSSRRSDGLPVRGLPLDANFVPKPAYTSIAASLSNAAAR